MCGEFGGRHRRGRRPSCVPEGTKSLSTSTLSGVRRSAVDESAGAHGMGGMNSCGSMHGVVMHDNSFEVHVNSWGALGHRNSCNSHAAGVQG